jgi:hypothetical protein
LNGLASDPYAGGVMLLAADAARLTGLVNAVVNDFSDVFASPMLSTVIGGAAPAAPKILESSAWRWLSTLPWNDEAAVCAFCAISEPACVRCWSRRPNWRAAAVLFSVPLLANENVEARLAS